MFVAGVNFRLTLAQFLRQGGGARQGSSGGRAFTLVEILIVVVILGILASIVVPQMTNASQLARESTLKDELRYLRTEISVYKAQHLDTAPGSGTGNFLQQMTLSSDEMGNTNATQTPVFRLGPYLSQMPSNPLNTLTAIKISTQPNLTTVVDDTTGWIYNPLNQQIIANQSGADKNGMPYSQY